MDNLNISNLSNEELLDAFEGEALACVNEDVIKELKEEILQRMTVARKD